MSRRAGAAPPPGPATPPGRWPEAPGELRRLVALAVTLAPARAARLLGRLDAPGAGDAVQWAGALSGSPRRARLAALAASLGEAGSDRGGPLPGHPWLRRLERERRARPVAERTPVRRAAAAAPLAPGIPVASARHGA